MLKNTLNKIWFLLFLFFIVDFKNAVIYCKLLSNTLLINLNARTFADCFFWHFSVLVQYGPGKAARRSPNERESEGGACAGGRSGAGSKASESADVSG